MKGTKKKTHYARTGNRNDFNDTGEREILCLQIIQNHVRCIQKRQKCAQNQGEMLCMYTLYICYAYGRFAAKYGRLRAYTNLV